MKELHVNTSGGAGSVHLGDHRLPIAGRVSMDALAADVIDLSVGAVQRGARAELAVQSGAHSYEILAGLRRRRPGRYPYPECEA